MTEEVTTLVRKLATGKLIDAEAAQRGYVATPDFGTKFEELLRGEYWSNMANVLRKWDRITVRYDFEDDAYLAEFLVRASDGVRSVKVELLEKHDLRKFARAEEVHPPKGYEVRQLGASGFGVFKGKDKIKDGLDTREAAVALAHSHARTFKD